jgi:hypothetical protein
MPEMTDAPGGLGLVADGLAGKGFEVGLPESPDGAPAVRDLAALAGTAQLKGLADALTQQGYDATLITLAPYPAVGIPGAAVPQKIYNTGGQFWWHTSQVIAPAGQVLLAAEMITRALRAHPHQLAAHDATSLLTVTPGQSAPPHPASSSGGGPEC